MPTLFVESVMYSLFDRTVAHGQVMLRDAANLDIARLEGREKGSDTMCEWVVAGIETANILCAQSYTVFRRQID
jgi:hypothetical protein